MKKWVIAFLLGIGVPFACNLSYVRLEFPKDILNGDWDGLDSFQDSSMYKMCSSYIRSWWLLGFEGVDALPSVLDSNIFIANSWEGDNFFSFYAFSQSEQTMLDVIKDELYHYQECEYITYSKRKLDSIFVQMEETLGALEEDFDIWYEYPCRYSYTAKDELVGTHFAQSYCSDTLAFCPCYYGAPVGHTDIPRVIDSVYKARCGIDGINTVKLIDEGNKVVVSNDIIQIPYQYKDHTYSLTDLQGRILEQGFLGSQLPRSKRPIILKINGLKATYIK